MAVLLRPSRSVAHRAAGIAVIALALLTACSSSTDPAADEASATGPSTEVPASPSGEPALDPPPTGIVLPLSWESASAREAGAGYVMALSATSRPDVYDGRYFHRDDDGAVDGQVFVTVRVTGPTSIDVTFSGSQGATGSLALADDASGASSINLGPACAGVLVEEATLADCVLFDATGRASPSPTASSPPPVTPATSADEAMGYLCSVAVEELGDVTEPTSDAFATSVLQVALGLLEYDAGAVDGVYGATTEGAVRAFQSDAGITVDGLVGPQTWASLQAAACRLPEDPAE
ncbi:MAG: peptidoglycan-binding domain-containing protein [Actinomycetota bacterium]|nr:peptidoglycan-binding domain-containing protein [Actinomycetota bacterium]